MVEQDPVIWLKEPATADDKKLFDKAFLRMLVKTKTDLDKKLPKTIDMTRMTVNQLGRMRLKWKNIDEKHVKLSYSQIRALYERIRYLSDEPHDLKQKIKDSDIANEYDGFDMNDLLDNGVNRPNIPVSQESVSDEERVQSMMEPLESPTEYTTVKFAISKQHGNPKSILRTKERAYWGKLYDRFEPDCKKLIELRVALKKNRREQKELLKQVSKFFSKSDLMRCISSESEEIFSESSQK